MPTVVDSTIAADTHAITDVSIMFTVPHRVPLTIGSDGRTAPDTVTFATWRDFRYASSGRGRRLGVLVLIGVLRKCGSADEHSRDCGTE